MYDVVAHHLLTSHNHNLLYSPVKELLQTSSIVPSLFPQSLHFLLVFLKQPIHLRHSFRRRWHKSAIFHQGSEGEDR